PGFGAASVSVAVGPSVVIVAPRDTPVVVHTSDWSRQGRGRFVESVSSVIVYVPGSNPANSCVCPIASENDPPPTGCGPVVWKANICDEFVTDDAFTILNVQPGCHSFSPDPVNGTAPASEAAS